MESSHTAHPEDLDMVDSTFGDPDVNTFTRMDRLGPQVVGQFLETGPGDLGVPGLWTLICSAGGAGSSRLAA